MGAIDPGKIRAYENERKRHLMKADDLLMDIAKHAERMREQLGRGHVPVSEAGTLAVRAVRLVERLAALEALNKVAYLTEGDSGG